jgi:hypothetical protein
MVKTGPIRGDFPSLKLRRMVRYGSTIERDLLYFLEYWDAVTWYQEQPMTIARELSDGHLQHYTPDYEIHEGSVKSIVECKAEARLESEHSQQQREIGQSWAEENGYHFVTFTETELRTGSKLDNVRLFWRYARLQVPKPLQANILSVVDPHLTVIRICQQLDRLPEQIIPAVCHLLFHHQLQMDIAQPFSIASEIWLPERQNHGAG